jgi:flagellar hook-length control protein FliK
MITVTFATRPAVAPPPEPPSPVAPRPLGQDFGGVFDLLSQDPDPADPAAAGHDGPADAANAPRDRPPEDGAPDQTDRDKDGREATGAEAGMTAAGERPDRRANAAAEHPSDATSEATVPVAGPAGAPHVGDSGPLGPALSGPATAGPDPSVVAEADEITEGAKQIFLAADQQEGGRKPSLAAGVPAFWAAREAAEAEGATPQDPALPPPAPSPKDMTPPIRTGQTQVAGEALLPGHDEAVLQQEPALSPAPAVPPSGAAGPAPSVPMTTLPPPVPAGPAATLPPQVPAQIAAAIAARPERPLELRLSPAELGGMTLNLRQDGDILRVVLQADRPDTLDLLRRNGDILLEELRLAGFSGADLSFADDGGARDRPELAPSRSALQSDSPRAPALPPPSPSLQAAQGLDLRL